MFPSSVHKLLHKDVDETTFLYALIEGAAQDDLEIFTRLSDLDVRKTPLFKGELALTNAYTAPYLLRIDNQPEIAAWLLENGWGRGWGIFFTSTAEGKTLLAHLRSFFALKAPNGRDVFFRFFDPVILRDFLPGLAPREAAAFFGPIERFVVEDEKGAPREYAKPSGNPGTLPKPRAVVFGSKKPFSQPWRRRLLARHVEKYSQLGFGVKADEEADALTLTDQAGAKVHLQKTAAGVSVTTDEGRLFDYALTDCKNPAEITDPAGSKIGIDISERENLVCGIRMEQGKKAWVFDYDEMDYLEKIHFPDGAVAHVTHDTYGHLEGFTDRNGHSTRFERNEYELLTKIVDANGGQTAFEYQDRCAPSRIAFADGAAFGFEYTVEGALAKLLAGGEAVAHYHVDAESSSWEVSYKDGGFARFEVRNGKIVKAVNPAGTVELAYDQKGCLISETFAGHTVAYKRNQTGHLTALVTPTGEALKFDRDGEGRVRRITDWGGRPIEITYAKNGALEEISYPNATSLYQTSYASGFCAELKLSTKGADQPLFQQKYARDLLDRVTEVRKGEKTTAYTYDREGRLLSTQSSDPDFSETFTLDPKGNCLADRHQPYTVNAADRVQKAGRTVFFHDPMGNLSHGVCPKGAAFFTYSALNRLASARINDTCAHYTYDAFGRRVEKKIGKTCTRYIWAGAQLLREIQITENEAVAVDYLFFPQTPVLLAIRRGERTCYAAFGQRYEVLCLTDAAGKVVWQADYDALGNARIKQGHDIFQPLRLCGHYHDAETGLHYAAARYYDPRLGRYLSLDPLFREGGGDNFYIYCNGDPINRIDPTGEFIFIPILIGAALGAAIGAGIEAMRQRQAAKDYDGFKIATAALLGGAIGAVGGGMGAAVEAAVAAGTTGTALAAATLAGMGTTGFLSGTAGSAAEQCTEALISGNGIHPLEITKQALTDGVIGAGIGLATFGTGGFVARRLKKATALWYEPKGRPARQVALRENAPKIDPRQKPPPEKLQQKRRNIADHSDKTHTAEPVDAVSGEVVLAQTDFTLPGRIPITWTRRYGSRSDYDGLLGRGWQTPADARLVLDRDGHVTFLTGSPGGLVFEHLPAADTPVTEPVQGAVLKAEENHFSVKLKSGLTYRFKKELSAGRTLVVHIADANGNHLDFVREGQNLICIRESSARRIDITSENGRITAMTLNGKVLVRYHYENDALAAAFDPAGQARRFYYQESRLTRHMDKNKLSFYYEYNQEGRCVHSTGDSGLYDYRFDYPPCECKTRVTDSRGFVKTYHYDHDRLPVKIEDHNGAATAYRYDAVGRVIRVTDPLGRKTEYDYDTAGNLTALYRPDERHMGFVFDEHNRPVQVLDFNGRIWEQHFDEKGRLIEKISPLNGRTRYSYTSFGDLESATDPEGRKTRFEWDPNGQLAAAIDPQGARTQYLRDDLGNITAVIDPAGGESRYVYDKASRLVQAVRPSGKSRSFAWDPEDNLTVATDENGHQTRFEYTGLNEIKKRINADSTQIRYHYDSEENLTAVTNEKGESHHFCHDHAGRVIAQTDYYGHSHAYVYDPAGQLIESTDPLSRTIAYAYDPAGRLTAKTFETEEREAFAWDGNGNLIAFDSPEAGLVERYYDAEGNLLAEKTGDFIVEYQYDQSGRRTQRQTAHGNTVRYSYDAAGRLCAIKINDNPIAITRDNLGQITGEHLTQYLQRSFSYDEDGLLTGQKIKGAGAGIERSFEYDPCGNLIGRQDSQKGTWRFVHDPMGRIIEASDPEHRISRFTYDPAGDLLRHLPQATSGLRAAAYQNAAYRFDAAGNLVEREKDEERTRYYWDDQNRLKAVRKSDGALVRLAYDALGRRRHKITTDGRTTFFWDGDTLLSEQFDDENEREYVFYPGTFEPLAVIDGNGQVYYYHNDVNGLPQELTRHNGDIVWSAGYDALGRVERLYTNEVRQPLRMQGQYFDEELGLCYNRHRYFNPAICSFISQDPLGLAAGENLYAYAPNVWGWVDPLGLCKATSTSEKSTSLQKFYPDKEGFLGATERKYLMPGEKIDRYGGSDYSRYFSPGGTPKAARALPPETAKQPLRTFDVVKPFEVETGTVAPAFGEMGFGTQYRTPVRLKILLNRGVISEIP